jgi:hypothetical protein
MVIERFKNRDPVPVYRRFRHKGRMTPEGLEYLSSWVDTKLERCFQIMETSDPKLMTEWAAHWSDIVDFEVVPVMSSADAVRAMQPKLSGAAPD